MFDVAINNARVVDGTGAAREPGSIGVRGGRIANISPENLDATEVLDAGGRIVCPGFIDLHSHADFSIESHPAAETQLAQGVTTIVAGNCGQSPFPITDLEELRSSTSFFDPELSWSWTDLAGYREAIASVRPGINLGLQVGHGALRLAAMGAAERPPSDADLDRMCGLLRDAAAQGALGFSTGLIYAPGSYAHTDEVEALAATAAACGLLYSTHMRDEADHVLEAVDEALGIAHRTGVRLEISHIKAMGKRNHGKVDKILERIDQAASAGLDVAADVYPYTASSTTLASRLPSWTMDGGAHGLLTRLADPQQRRRIRGELASRFDGSADPAGIILAGMPSGSYSDCVGMSVVDVAERDGIEPAEAVLAILQAHHASVTIVNHAMAEADLEAALQHPLVSVASDGWVLALTGNGMPHPRSFGTYPRVLGRYVREQGVLSLEAAVRKMTSLPASRVALGDRGVIRQDAIADLVVLDPTVVADRSTYADPWNLAVGVEHVVVNGRVAMHHGTVLNGSAGTVL